MHTGRWGAGVCAARIWGLDACGVLGGWGVCCHSELDVRQPGLTLPLWAQGLVPKTRAGRKASCPPLGQTPSNVPSTVCLLSEVANAHLPANGGQPGAAFTPASERAASGPTPPGTPPPPPLAAHKQDTGTSLCSGHRLRFNSEFTRDGASHHTGQPFSIHLRAKHSSSSPRESSGGLWGPSGAAPGYTSLPKKKYSTRFCIRIYYLKDSLKIKILYSIMNSFFFFFVSVNKTVLRKRGFVESGAESTSLRGWLPRGSARLVQDRGL